MDFRGGVIRVESQDQRNSTLVEIKPAGSDQFLKCVEYPRSIGEVTHTYISSGSPVNMAGKRRGVYINEIKFYDNEDEIAGEQQSLDDETKDHVFDSQVSANDLLHMGNRQAALFNDEEHGRHAYNDQLTRYNNKYANLVGKFHTNIEGIDQIVSHLPAEEMLNKLQQDIFVFGGI